MGFSCGCSPCGLARRMCQHDGEDPYKKEDMHCNFEEQVAELFVKDGQMSRCQTVK